MLSVCMREELLQAVRDGESISASARRLGIPRQTIYGWRSRDRDFARALSDAVRSHRAASVDEAGQDTPLSEAELLAIVERAAQRDWRAARWLLERIDRSGPPLQERDDPLAEVIDLAKRRGS